MDDESYPLGLPASLKRDASNRAEFMSMAELAPEVEMEHAPATPKPKAVTKPKGVASAKRAGKPPAKAKSAPKAAVKAAKGPDKAKAPKAVVKKDAYGFRDGSAKAKAVAMYARKLGATLAEVKEKVGSVQLNVLNSLEAEGYEVERKTEKRKDARAVTRYFLKGKK